MCCSGCPILPSFMNNFFEIDEIVLVLNMHEIYLQLEALSNNQSINRLSLFANVLRTSDNVINVKNGEKNLIPEFTENIICSI
jgi:hypothetical protein